LLSLSELGAQLAASYAAENFRAAGKDGPATQRGPYMRFEGWPLPT